MNRYTAFALLLVPLLASLLVKTINAQGTPVPTPVSPTNQATPTSPITNTISVTPTVPVTAATTGAVQAVTGTVLNANILNVRSGPGIDFTRLTTLTNGVSVTIIGRDTPSTWLQLQLPAGQIGWVSSQFVRSSFLLNNVPIVSATPALGTGGAAIATVSTDILNVRSGPGLTFGRLTTITQGQTATLLGRNTDSAWVQVLLPDGRTGWVSSQFVTANLALNTLPITNT